MNDPNARFHVRFRRIASPSLAHDLERTAVRKSHVSAWGTLPFWSQKLVTRACDPVEHISQCDRDTPIWSQVRTNFVEKSAMNTLRVIPEPVPSSRMPLILWR